MARKHGSQGGRTKNDHAGEGTPAASADSAERGAARALPVGAFALGAIATVIGAGLFGAFTRTGRKLVTEGLAAGNRAIDAGNRTLARTGLTPGSAEHVPTDLMGDTHPGPNDRATPDFRPNIDAPMSEAEREALRPPQGPGPTLVAGQADENLRVNAAQS